MSRLCTQVSSNPLRRCPPTSSGPFTSFTLRSAGGKLRDMTHGIGGFLHGWPGKRLEVGRVTRSPELGCDLYNSHDPVSVKLIQFDLP